MKRMCFFLVCLLVALASGEVNRERSLQLQLQPGQVLKLELSSGDYRIEPGASDKVVVLSQGKQNPRQIKPRFGIDTTPEEAAVKVEGPQNYAAVIQVPRNSNLKIRLTGGSLRVQGIYGDKDIESHAGAVSIDVGRPEAYARVDASVDIGHIDAAPFQVAEKGLDRSFSRQGPGSYRLHAHVDSGEITLFTGTL